VKACASPAAFGGTVPSLILRSSPPGWLTAVKIAATATLAVLAGCAANSGAPGAGAAPPLVDGVAGAPPLGNYIKHVVIIVQENRSFEDMFAGWPGADAPMYGWSNQSGKRLKVPLTPQPFQRKGLDHLWINAMAGWDHGQMDGFWNNRNGPTGPPSGNFAYSYLERSEIGPYRTMAAQYVLADHMFPTMFGPSFTAHLDLVAGTTNISDTTAIVNLPNGAPWGCDASPGTATSLLTRNRTVRMGVGPFPCFSRFRTMADTLDAKGISWKYYAPNILEGPAWSAFDAIKNVRHGADWAKVTSPQTLALTDPGTGALPSVSWITPDYLDSDHPETGSDTGPSWVGSLVNEIGKSPYWDSTAIVILWDDWGGWYDNVPPPQLDSKGLGIRVGCLIVSPYARKGYVSHTQYEFGSILKFIEQAFDVPPLGPGSAGYTDARARSLVDSFDFTQAPRAFVPIKTKYSTKYFLNRPQSLMVPDKE
jgi:phospholipase C